MSWEDEIRELKAREALAYEMGGPDKVARQHEFKKLTIRERIDAMSDAESFHEIGTLAGVGKYDDDGNLTSFTPSNFVFGTAEIDGRPVILSGDEAHIVAAEPASQVIDTTGAGDQFAAGFLYGYTQGRGLAEAARIGGIAAAEVIAHYGARPEVDLGALARERLG